MVGITGHDGHGRHGGSGGHEEPGRGEWRRVDRAQRSMAGHEGGIR